MAKNPEHYAIVIGIDGYRQIPPLKAAVEDANKFVKWLLSEDGGGLPTTNIEPIYSPRNQSLNPDEAKPIQKEIDDALGRMGMRMNGRIGERLYFYFAGHGIGQNEDVAMLMATAAEWQLNSNIGLDAYRSFFHRTKPFDEIVFIIDCCRSPLPEGIESIDLRKPDFTLPKSSREKKVQDFLVLAAQSGKKAFEPIDPKTGERRSILTRAVLEGFVNPEAADLLGRVTAFSLGKYIEKQVPSLAPTPELKQDPVVDLKNLSDDIVICTIPNHTLPKVKVLIETTVPEIGGRLELMDSDWRFITSQPTAKARSGSPWELFLLKGKWYGLTYNGVPGAPKMPLNFMDDGNGTITVVYKL
jgi:hypothetical protein